MASLDYSSDIILLGICVKSVKIMPTCLIPPPLKKAVLQLVQKG